MSNIISAVIFIVSLYAGTTTLKLIHDSIRKAALEKAGKGLPSLTEMTSQLQKHKSKK